MNTGRPASVASFGSSVSSSPGAGRSSRTARSPRPGRGARIRQLGERRVGAEQHQAEAVVVGGEREQQQPDLVLFARQAGGQQLRTGVVARAVMEAGAELVAQVHAEEVLLGDAALGGLPAGAELDQQRQQHLAGGEVGG